MFSRSVGHVCSPLNSEGHQSFDICQRGSWEFLWYSDPSERNHSNRGLLWNSFAPSPLMPQTDPPHIRRTSIPTHTYVCVSECARLCCVCVIVQVHAHLFFCVLPHMPPGWSSARGTWRIAFPAEVGSWGCCAETLRQRAWFTVRRGTRRDWQCFLKPSSRPRGRQPSPQPCLTPLAPPPPQKKISKPKTLNKQRPSQVRQGRSKRVLMLSLLS